MKLFSKKDKLNSDSRFDALTGREKLLRKIAIAVAFASTYYFLVKLVFL